MADDDVNTTAVIGLLIGFLVVGVIGVYVGDSLIEATDLTGVSSTTMSNATVGSANTTFPANVISIDLALYGGGGGGGAGNNSAGGRGGGAGGQGHETIATGIAISAGQWINYTVGDGGAGGVNASGATGATTTIVLNGVPYTAAGGVGGGNGTSPNSDGVSGTTGYGASYTSVAGSDGAYGNWGGLAAIGVGAGGGGGGAGNGTANGGHGGKGSHGSVQATVYYTDGAANPLATSQNSVVETFQLGVLLCKIIIIVSIASLVFTLLQRTGLIPRFGGGDEGM